MSRHTTTIRRATGNDEAPLRQEGIRFLLLDLSQWGRCFVANGRQAAQLRAAAKAIGVETACERRGSGWMVTEVRG